ncbi:uncharacterized protein [Watersipora subatra]|uniref:uncharacterized protein n=1 Tax=Watersipora subatra TaxID=2589382 RepID=UPI00355BE868
MTFKTDLITTKPNIQVRFDSIKRKISADDVSIILYDSDTPKVGKKLLTVSKSKPITANSTVVARSRYLTIEVNRDARKSKNFDVEMILVPVSSAGAIKWSFVTATLLLIAGWLL